VAGEAAAVTSLPAPVLLLVALRNAGIPMLIHRNRAYFIGTDGRGRRFEIIVADDTYDDLWHAIHALQISYPKKT
jgi:hypothetical protein